MRRLAESQVSKSARPEAAGGLVPVCPLLGRNDYGHRLCQFLSVGPYPGSHSRQEKQSVRDRLRRRIHPRDPKTREFADAAVSPVCGELLRGFT